MTNDGKTDQNAPKKGNLKSNEKQDRLAEALRANLRKRKTQAKDRTQTD